MDLPPPGSKRMKYGEVAYRLRVIVDTLSWATGLKPSHVTLALILAFILALGSAVTGTVLLFTSDRSGPSLRPGDGAYGPVNGDEAAAEAERTAAEAAKGSGGSKDSTRFAGSGSSGAHGAAPSSGGTTAGASWPGTGGSGGPVGGSGGSYGRRTIPVYGGNEAGGGSSGREETSGAPKRARRTAGEGGRGDGARPGFRAFKIGFGNDTGIQSQAYVGTGGGQGNLPGGSEGEGGGPVGQAQGGLQGGGASKGAGKYGLTPLSKIPDIGSGRAVKDANAKGRMPKSSHGIPKGPGEDEDKDKKKREEEARGDFKASKAAAPGAQDGRDAKDGTDWDIYLDKSKAHDLPDGPGVHTPPQEAQTIGAK